VPTDDPWRLALLPHPGRPGVGPAADRPPSAWGLPRGIPQSRAQPRRPERLGICRERTLPREAGRDAHSALDERRSRPRGPRVPLTLQRAQQRGDRVSTVFEFENEELLHPPVAYPRARASDSISGVSPVWGADRVGWASVPPGAYAPRGERSARRSRKKPGQARGLNTRPSVGRTRRIRAGPVFVRARSSCPIIRCAPARISDV